MKIYEHQAKELFQRYGIPVPRGLVAKTPQGAVSAARSLETLPIVVKAQTFAGGRGRAGGIRLAGSLDEVEAAASALLNRKLVTAQTGPDGQQVNSLLIEEAVPIDRELYLGITIDRAKRCVALIVSKEGGVEIEKLAVKAPAKIVVEPVNPAFGLRPFQASRAFFSLGLPHRIVSLSASRAMALYKLFVENDCSIAEINPLVVTESGEITALDAKITIDDNALFRHPDLASLNDAAQEQGLEAEARKVGLNYIKLKGNVGCMVNGAGLAMATMDLIKVAGAEPADFLDVGGGATAAMIKEGLRVLLADRDVKLLFINIFGGILRCDVLAEGVTAAAKDLDIRLPVVVRLEGTNKEKGREILASSGISFIAVDSLKEGAERIKREVEKLTR
jgi:succinyl-CoA synthetase beta subunit